ncbi:MAG: hypothetical protein MK212_10075 [Saprospiraceae bacterium]|nr:hypothetical protein [Saprospiraceae bacterium]
MSILKSTLLFLSCCFLFACSNDQTNNSPSNNPKENSKDTILSNPNRSDLTDKPHTPKDLLQGAWVVEGSEEVEVRMMVSNDTMHSTESLEYGPSTFILDGDQLITKNAGLDMVDTLKVLTLSETKFITVTKNGAKTIWNKVQ